MKNTSRKPKNKIADLKGGGFKGLSAVQLLMPKLGCANGPECSFCGTSTKHGCQNEERRTKDIDLLDDSQKTLSYGFQPLRFQPKVPKTWRKP